MLAKHTRLIMICNVLLLLAGLVFWDLYPYMTVKSLKESLPEGPPVGSVD